MYHPDGASPRFGSCYFTLHHDISYRTTYNFGGSHEENALEKSGSLYEIDSIMASIFEEIQKGKGVFGIDEITIYNFLKYFTDKYPDMGNKQFNNSLSSNLDSFIEAQIHGSIKLDRDVEKLVIDPSFIGTEIEKILNAIALKYNIKIKRHPSTLR